MVVPLSHLVSVTLRPRRLLAPAASRSSDKTSICTFEYFPRMCISMVMVVMIMVMAAQCDTEPTHSLTHSFPHHAHSPITPSLTPPSSLPPSPQMHTRHTTDQRAAFFQTSVSTPPHYPSITTQVSPPSITTKYHHQVSPPSI